MDRAETFESALKLSPAKTALLVVDMQRAFLDPGEAMEVPAARDIVPQIQSLLALFRSHGLPVVYTEFTYAETLPLLIGHLHPEHRRAPAGTSRVFGRPPRRVSSARPMSTWFPSSPRTRTSSW